MTFSFEATFKGSVLSGTVGGDAAEAYDAAYSLCAEFFGDVEWTLLFFKKI